MCCRKDRRWGIGATKLRLRRRNKFLTAPEMEGSREQTLLTLLTLREANL
jgi:hypothetical protein